MHSLKIRREIELQRRKGYSSESLSQMYSIPRGTIYYWVRHISLSQEAQKRLDLHSQQGKKLGLMHIRQGRQEELARIVAGAQEDIVKIPQSVPLFKLLCAVLFWAEGAKTTHSVRFINSDPVMIQTFLSLFRRSFRTDEKRFRVILHIHQYHDEKELKVYWSSITGIPLSQFNKSYRKANTGKTKKKGYKGCASIYYFDAKIAKELTALYNALYPWVVDTSAGQGI